MTLPYVEVARRWACVGGPLDGMKFVRAGPSRLEPDGSLLVHVYAPWSADKPPRAAVYEFRPDAEGVARTAVFVRDA